MPEPPLVCFLISASDTAIELSSSARVAFACSPDLEPSARFLTRAWREEWQKMVPRTLHFSRTAICSTSVMMPATFHRASAGHGGADEDIGAHKVQAVHGHEGKGDGGAANRTGGWARVQAPSAGGVPMNQKTINCGLGAQRLLRLTVTVYAACFSLPAPQKECRRRPLRG
jgi:hypothetical protein